MQDGCGDGGRTARRNGAAQEAEAVPADNRQGRGADLTARIESLRQELYRAADRSPSLRAPGVREVSETLDRLIVRLHRRQGGGRERRGGG